jgi:hypothetical protein
MFLRLEGNGYLQFITKSDDVVNNHLPNFSNCSYLDIPSTGLLIALVWDLVRCKIGADIGDGKVQEEAQVKIPCKTEATDGMFPKSTPHYNYNEGK